MKKCLSLLFALMLMGVYPLSTTFGDTPDRDPGGFHRVDSPVPPPAAIHDGFVSITGRDADSYLRFLASDLLEGREVASSGYDIAAEFVAALFRMWGLEPAGDLIHDAPRARNLLSAGSDARKSPSRSYFQDVVMREVLSTTGSITAESKRSGVRRERTFIHGIDYTSTSTGTWSITAPVVFAGHGIVEKSLKYDDYHGIQAKDRIVMILNEAPGADLADSPFHQDEYEKRYFQPRRRMHGGDLRTKTAAEKGALAVLLVENRPQKNRYLGAKILDRDKVDDSGPVFDPGRRRLLLPHSNNPDPRAPIPTYQISRRMAAEIVATCGESLENLQSVINTTYKPASRLLSRVRLTLNTKSRTQLVRSRNVLAVLEGADAEVKNEVIVIGAHLDHLGKKGPYIFNGADDNGSGVCGVLEVAQAFAVNPTRPKRTVLFALWTGEESGLLGSTYYVAHPTYPLAKTVANLNLDMISRRWTREQLESMRRWRGMDIPQKELEQIDVDRFMILSRARGSFPVREALKQANALVGMHLLIRPSTGFGGSDHAPFAFKGIPWVFFFSAMTQDYHMPSDSLEKVSLDHLENVSRLVYATAFHLAGWDSENKVLE
ncbi:MAG TPA: M20/M25/M40 family metallo-hydrolase [Candidatus Aminicenantes bacterium]|nr:M20/M25/M40 family metallo-hydrolase [Candidatus Aminicenantes bacterium]